MPGKKEGIRAIEVSGTPRQIGSRLGKELGHIAESMISGTRTRLKRSGVSWENAMELTRTYMLQACSYDPDYVQWIEGYSEASGIPFDDLTVLLMDGESGFCTDVLLSAPATDGGVVYSAHTEDWRAKDQDHVVLIKGRPKNGPAFLAVSLGGIELDAGMNSAGISYTGNSLNQDDTRVGIPKMFLARRMLAARTVEQALAVATTANRASSYNLNIAHKSGAICCVEGSAKQHALLRPKQGFLVHTNHYLDKRMITHEMLFKDSGIPPAEAADSLSRFGQALRFVRENHGRIGTVDLKCLLSDHVEYPYSICYHGSLRGPPLSRTKTIFAVVMDLTHSEMHACIDNPCKGKWRKFDLGY